MTIQSGAIVSVQQLHSFCKYDKNESQREPLNWFDVQAKAIIYAKRKPTAFSWKLIFRNDVVFLWHSPSVYAFLTCLLNRQTIYLCWGLPRKSSFSFFYHLKKWKLQLILCFSRVILVNDEKTLADLSALKVGAVRLFPYIVDADFFRFSPYSYRESFVLIPGDNDRDENLINQLSSILPCKIVRVTRDRKVLDFHKNNTNSTIEVRFNICFSELSLLYQTARVVILPIKTDEHVAGQTSILEALACGTPVLITKGLTSSIFRNYASVLEVQKNDLDLWVKASKKVLSQTTDQSCMLEVVSSRVKSVHNPETVAIQLSKVIESVSK